MRLAEFVPGLASDLDVTGVAADSRAVAPGDLFVALPGARADGRAHIAEAVRRGAAAVLAPRGTPWPDGVPPRPLIEDDEPRRTLALIAARLSGPSPETVVAVTGTNGKTSTVEFLRQIWTAEGRNAASLGTLGLVAPPPSLRDTSPASGGGQESETNVLPCGAGEGDHAKHGGGGASTPSALTTPDPIHLAHLLTTLRRHGITAVALEASSHGLDQHRLDGLTPAAAALTNITRDHLDYHGTLDAYRAAKLRLFDTLLPEGAPAIVSSETDAETLAALRAIAARRRLDLRIVGTDGDAIRLANATPTPAGQTLTVLADGARREVPLPLPGRFQADNALVAAALAQATGVRDPLAHLPALRGVRGRLELACVLPNGAAAYVDYAHTPDAIARVLRAMRPHARRLHIVLGAGGDRDPGKRPLMGHAATEADTIIVTDDNPRSEDPAAIRAAIRQAAPEAREIGDRSRAIAEALSALGPGDVLIVAGKGHEQGQIIGDETIPFDDRAVIRDLAGAPKDQK